MIQIEFSPKKPGEHPQTITVSGPIIKALQTLLEEVVRQVNKDKRQK